MRHGAEIRPAVTALLALSEAIESRDPYTRGHSARVARMAHAVGLRLGCDEARLALIGLGGALHDVGKLAVSKAVLNKPGPLTPEEVAEVRTHPEIGARLVALDRALRPALPGVLYHHERWDGGGYPTGRAGTKIPFEARILAVADCFDAMTSDRPYRAALAAEQAIEEVDRCAGTQFDPDVATAFLAAWESGAFGVTAALRAVARLKQATQCYKSSPPPEQTESRSSNTVLQGESG
jgi:HD-GYP domain-containing protein (c-di-GMP phosphodiesterase class II)